MLVIVLIFNVLISLLCLYVAWQVWNLRQALANAAEIMTAAERSVYNVLHNAPDAIEKGQLGADRLRHSYQRLELQIKQIRQVLMLLGLVNSIWRSTVNSVSTSKVSSRHKPLKSSPEEKYSSEQLHNLKRHRQLRKRKGHGSR
ncbi:MAG: hypothetical protein F6K36_17960 [Symploca sp. SIO3C6]|uniref:Uncharacterized protein n=1 Tax=Symploca sp. SIO1C4 TaxID=2607765 RepID=A0A6B3N5G2_9CYAN|nr:hypothetical protein [Symploca sp. SIO3C6]NER28369.1 hypothetical protein [Symploca sp. SIO1C4]